MLDVVAAGEGVEGGSCGASWAGDDRTGLPGRKLRHDPHGYLGEHELCEDLDDGVFLEEAWEEEEIDLKHKRNISKH